jgi:hypothetical protein
MAFGHDWPHCFPKVAKDLPIPVENSRSHRQSAAMSRRRLF